MLLLQILRRLGKYPFPMLLLTLTDRALLFSMACAIREAYAACVNVAILVDGVRDEEDL